MDLCSKSNSETKVAQSVGVFFPDNLGSSGPCLQIQTFSLCYRFKNAEVRLQTAGLNIHQACHRAHLQDEQEPHEYLCDAIRQSNEPQGQRESCSNAQGRDISLFSGCLQQYLRGPFVTECFLSCRGQIPLKQGLISWVFFHPRKSFFCIWAMEFGPVFTLSCKFSLVQSVFQTGSMAVDRI